MSSGTAGRVVINYLLFTQKHTGPRSINIMLLLHRAIRAMDHWSIILFTSFRGMLLPAMAFTTALAVVLSVVLSKILNIRKTQDVSFSVIIDLL
jgi:hypothetical protein